MSQCSTHVTDVVLHLRTIRAKKGDIDACIGTEPEVLIFQVDETLDIAHRIAIQLSDALHNHRLEVVGMFRYGTSNLNKWCRSLNW